MLLWNILLCRNCTFRFVMILRLLEWINVVYAWFRCIACYKWAWEHENMKNEGKSEAFKISHKSKMCYKLQVDKVIIHIIFLSNMWHVGALKCNQSHLEDMVAQGSCIWPKVYFTLWPYRRWMSHLNSHATPYSHTIRMPNSP